MHSKSQTSSHVSDAGPGFLMSIFGELGKFHCAAISDQDFGDDGVSGSSLEELSSEGIQIAAAVFKYALFGDT